MSEDHIARLDDLATELDADEPDYEAVTDALDRVERAYDERERAEQTRLRRSLVVRDHQDVAEDVRERLDSYANRQTTTDIERATVLGSVAAYLIDPREHDRSTVREQLSQLGESEVGLQEHASAVEDLLADRTIPGWISLVYSDDPPELVPEGAAAEVTHEVRNVGDETVEGVSVEAPDDLAATPEARAVGTVEPGQTVSVSFALPTDAPGRYRGLFTVETDGGGSDRREVGYEVLDVGEAAELGCSLTDEMAAEIEDSDAIAGGREESLTAKLDAACDSFERAESFAADGRSQPARNQLDTATQQMGAFLNQLAAFGGSGNGKGGGRGTGAPSLPRELRRTLTSQAEAVIERAATAKRAI